LFSQSEATTPIEQGSYTVETLKDGVWQPDETMFGRVVRISRDDRTYSMMSEDGKVVMRFLVFLPRPQFYLAEVQKGADTERLYALMSAWNGQITVMDAGCTELRNSVLAEQFKPDGVKTVGYSSECYFASKERLVAMMNAYRDIAKPLFRFTRAAGAEPAKSAAIGQQVQTGGSISNSTVASEDPQFTLSVCNKTKVSADYIVFHRHRQEEQKWQLEGWYKAEPGACRQIRIPRGYFYISANGADGSVWSGNDRRICIVNRAVERVVFEKEKCLVGETNRGFQEVFNKEDTFTYNLNPARQ